MNEITFLVEDAPEGGYTAKAIGASIYTEADTITELHQQLRCVTSVININNMNFLTVFKN